MSVGRAFMQFDVDGNGSLDLAELKRGARLGLLCSPPARVPSDRSQKLTTPLYLRACPSARSLPCDRL